MTQFDSRSWLHDLSWFSGYFKLNNFQQFFSYFYNQNIFVCLKLNNQTLLLTIKNIKVYKFSEKTGTESGTADHPGPVTGTGTGSADPLGLWQEPKLELDRSRDISDGNWSAFWLGPRLCLWLCLCLGFCLWLWLRQELRHGLGVIQKTQA